MVNLSHLLHVKIDDQLTISTYPFIFHTTRPFSIIGSISPLVCTPIWFSLKNCLNFQQCYTNRYHVFDKFYTISLFYLFEHPYIHAPFNFHKEYHSPNKFILYNLMQIHHSIKHTKFMILT